MRFSNDWPNILDVLGELRRRAGDMPLTVNVSFPEFLQALRRHTLPGGVFFNVYGDMDVPAANACMQAVRAYRA